MLTWIDALETADAFHGSFLQGMASDGIHRVGRVDDDASFFLYLDNACEVFGIVVLFVEFDKHIVFFVLGTEYTDFTDSVNVNIWLKPC